MTGSDLLKYVVRCIRIGTLTCSTYAMQWDVPLTKPVGKTIAGRAAEDRHN